MGSATVQGELWGRHAKVWAAGLETQMSPLFEATLDALEPLTGQRYLDAGCGAGLAIRLAADRGAAVSGMDASPGLLEVARERTPGADLQVGDIESLPFDDGSFDIVTAFNCIQYAVDPATAVSELARVCRAGGQVAIGIWGDPARCESEGLFGRLRSLAPMPPGAPAPLGCSDEGVVEGLLTKAGLVPGAHGEVPVSFTFTNHEQAWRDHTASGALQKLIDAAGADAVHRVLKDTLEADRKPDGALRQDNVFRYVVAAKVDDV